MKTVKIFICVILCTLISVGFGFTACDDSDSSNECSYDKIIYDEESSAPYEITMLNSVSGSQMLSMLIESSDGHLIVIDGGYSSDAKKLVNNIFARGGHVDAWFLTHPHDDHVNAFVEIFNSEIYKNIITVDTVYFNFPEYETVEQYESSSTETYTSLINCLESNKSELEIVNIIAGNYIQIGDISVDVMRVYNETITTNLINNSSAVLMFYLGSIKFCVLGDLGAESGEELLSMYTQEELDCDIVQMAHHGQSAVKEDVYKALSPSVSLWSTPLWLWNNDNGGGTGSGPWANIEDTKQWMTDIGCEIYGLYTGKDITIYID